MPELAAKNKNPIRAAARRPSLAMHSSQCAICRHPQRAEIERDFLDWVGPWHIVREYGLTSRNTVYRHAHALGLFARRDRTLRFALSRLIEQIDDVRPTAASIVSAIRLMAKLNARGEYAEEIELPELGDSPDAPSPEAATPGGQAESENIPPSDRSVPVARALPGAPACGGQPAQGRQIRNADAQPQPSKQNGEARKLAPAEDKHDGPPIAFAQTAGPRRRFFWRS